jgi:pimeloyl-ACP methyl ester carboxylesterase
MMGGAGRSTDAGGGGGRTTTRWVSSECCTVVTELTPLVGTSLCQVSWRGSSQPVHRDSPSGLPGATVPDGPAEVGPLRGRRVTSFHTDVLRVRACVMIRTRARRWLRAALLTAAGLLVVVGVLIASLVRPDLDPAALEGRYATPDSVFIEVDGLRVHVRDTKASGGPALVLLHGSMSSLHTWDGWIEELSPDVRVVAIDLPGHGLTGPDSRGRYSPSGMVEVVHTVVDAMDLGQVVIGGNSMGGGVAWRYAILHPDEVAGLVLVGSTGFQGQGGGPPAVMNVYRLPAVGPIVQRVTPRFAVARVLATTYGDPDRLDDATIDRYWELLRREGNRAATVDRFRAGGGDDGLVDRIGEVDVPVLVLWGALDTWIPLEAGERLAAAIPGADLVVFDDLGHVPMEEGPSRTATVVRDWLGRDVRE